MEWFTPFIFYGVNIFVCFVVLNLMMTIFQLNLALKCSIHQSVEVMPEINSQSSTCNVIEKGSSDQITKLAWAVNSV